MTTAAFPAARWSGPPCKKLLAEVEAERIDVIVVYKVDRLTRSLADFAKLVELFDAHKVSFVSVTQSFNTTTSMGRLTLNVLLSFAQFEREVTGERIRDKIAASKKKGMWMGGVVPLGYRVEDRALHGVEDHAAIVRMIFRRYLDAGSVVRLKQILDAEDIRLPVRVDGTGRSTGGGPFSRGHLYKILSNPIYIGRIAHKSQVHEGQHPSIVDRDLWDRVQGKLEDHGAAVKGNHTRQASDALLVGKLFDDRGNRMSPTWARKGSKRWRYYVSQAALQGEKDRAGSVARVSAAEIEGRVVEALRKIAPRAVDLDGDLTGEVDGAGIGWSQVTVADGRSPSGPCAGVRNLIDRVTIGKALIKIALSAHAAGEGDVNLLSIPWTAPSPYRRREVIHGASDEARRLVPMPQGARNLLIEAIRQAHRWLDRLLSDPSETIEAIASEEGKTERSIRMTLSLAFLAPDIVKAAIEGRLPRGCGLKRLVDLPIAWPDQWRVLGLSAPRRI